MTVLVVARRALEDMRRGLIGWSLGIAALVAVMASIWPSMRDVSELDVLLAAYPEPMRELFNIDAFTTGAGYLNTELFSFMLPGLLATFAISRGSRLVAGQEEAGVLEVVLALPRPRWQLLVGSALALAGGVAVLGAVLLGALVTAGQLAGMDVPIGEMAAASVAVTLFGVEFGLLAIAVGAVTGSRAAALGVPSVAAVAAYLLYAVARLVDRFDGWQVLSPVEHALRDGPVGAGWDLWALLAMAAAGAVALLIAAPVLARRDIGT